MKMILPPKKTPTNPTEKYFTEKSEYTDLSCCSYVNARIFPSHIEATGVSYAKKGKTIAELEIQIEELATKGYSEDEYNRRLKELEEQIAKRRQKHPP